MSERGLKHDQKHDPVLQEAREKIPTNNQETRIDTKLEQTIILSGRGQILLSHELGHKPN